MPPKHKPIKFEDNRTPIASDFGMYLRNLRVEKNLTAADVGRELSLSASTIKNIEAGHNPPPRPERLKLWLKAIGHSSKYKEAMAFLSAIKTTRMVKYLPRDPANEHVDRLLDAYESGNLSSADLDLLRMIAPGEYNRA